MKKTLFSLALLISIITFSQERVLAPLGSWQYHLPLHLAKNVAQTDTRVYCAAHAGLYYYDKEYNSTTQLTKEDGLNDIQISTINYYEPLDMLLIAYSNANIDILQGNEIININDINRKQILGEKSINAIHFKDDFAYLACSFGVVVLDLKRLEVKETYQSLGLNGEQLQVYDLCFNDSILFLGTEEGILFGTLSSSTNLLDFNNWNRYSTTDSLPNLECTKITAFNNNIYAYFSDTLDFTTYRLENNSWSLDTRFGETVHNFTSEEELITVFENKIKIFSENGEVSEINSNTGYLSDVIKDNKNDYFWGADLVLGLEKITYDAFETKKPNSPSNASIFALENVDNQIYALRGGYDGSKTQFSNPMQVDVLGTYGWTYRTYQYSPSATLFDMKDVSVAKYNNTNGKTYYGSFGYGMIEEYENEKYTIYNDQNSPLVNTLDSGKYVRVVDLATDEDGTVWITNHHGKISSPSVHALKDDGTWEGFIFSDVEGAAYPLKIIADKKDQKWVTLDIKHGGGILLFDKGNENHRLLTSVFEQGLLPDNDVRCITEDENGEIWIGTTNGVAVFDLPDLMFEDEIDNDARTPYFEGRPLLEEEIVSCIEVDKGNRKWIGTPRGIWLFDESGTEALLNFTEENSPLPSNNIIDIEIQNETGEVFISTSLGLVSYRGTSTLGYVECSEEVNVFPNPVTPEYEGEIAINGLKSNATIKIIDMAGNLTYETQGYGGGASWNAKTLEGERVASGVYQILVVGNARKNSCVTRVAVVN